MNLLNLKSAGCVALAALALAVPGVASAQTVTSVAPSTLARGATTEIIVRGEGLDSIVDVSVSGDDLVISGLFTTPTVARFSVGVGARAAIGERTVTLSGVDAIERPVEIVPGALSLLFIDPVGGARGDTLDVTIAGANLDTATSVDFGDGIEVTAFSASSPTRASATIVLGESAFAGTRPVIVRRTGSVAELAAAFMVSGGLPELTRVVPAYGVRGSSVDVRLEGRNFDRVDSVSFGARLLVSDFVVESPSRARATVAVGDGAFAGPRTVELRADEQSYVLERAFSVRRGPLDVIDVRPDRLRQRDRTFIIVDGLNLDGVHSVDAGAGVFVSGIVATQPTTISFDVVVDAEATVGFRDLTLTGPESAVTLNDAIAVGEYVAPPLDLRAPEEFTLADTQLGALRRGGFVIENRGRLNEAIEVVGVAGDLDTFSLVDASGERGNRVALTVVAESEVVITVEYEPRLRGRSGAQFDILARDGTEVAATVIARSTGTRQELRFNLAPPYVFDDTVADTPSALRRLDTLLADGVPSRSTLVQGYSLLVERDGLPVDAESVISVDAQSTIGSGELFWGTTEFAWNATLPAGEYVGELLITTDSTEAPMVPFRFSLTAIGGDVPDAGAPDSGAPDTGAGPDAGNVDAATPDAAQDTRLPDSGPLPDATTQDAAANDADGESDDTGRRQRSGGCTAATPRSTGAPWATLALTVAVVALRRQTRQGAASVAAT